MSEIHKSQELQEPADVVEAYRAWVQQISADRNDSRLEPDFYRRDYVSALEERATIDKLTGAKTRRVLDERMQQLIDNKARNVGFLFLDGNQVKQINDKLSDGYGDNYIQRTAIKLKDNTDSKKTEIFRRGGDEFVLIVDGITSSEELDAVGQRLCGIFSGGNETDNGAVIPTVAIGGMFLGADANEDQLENVLGQAEAAMKYTKKQTSAMVDQYKTTKFHQEDASVDFHFAPSSYVRYEASNADMVALIPKPQVSLVK